MYPVIAVFGLVVLVALTSPLQRVAEKWWPQTSAPWERVDAWLVQGSGQRVRVWRDVGSVEACRGLLATVESQGHDGGLRRGSCGIGRKGWDYRIVVELAPKP